MSGPGETSYSAPVIEPEVSREFLTHLLQGDRRACRGDVQRLLARGVTPRELYLDLFQASLYAVGDLWQRGEVSVSVEHLATAITEDLLALVFPTALARERCGRSAIVSCAADEFHQVGGRIVADTLEAQGWRVHFLGANGAEASLLTLLQETAPDLLALSVTIGAHLPVALRTVTAARALSPGVRIVVGGQALTDEAQGPFLAVGGVARVRSLGELDLVLSSWAA